MRRSPGSTDGPDLKGGRHFIDGLYRAALVRWKAEKGLDTPQAPDPDVVDSAREHVLARLAAAPAEAHALADELRGAIYDLLLQAGGEDSRGPEPSVETLRKMRRAYYGVQTEAHMEPEVILEEIAGVRMACKKHGTSVADGIRVLRGGEHGRALYVARVLKNWPDSDLASLLSAKNFNAVASKVLGSHGHAMSPANVDRKVNPRGRQKPA